MRHAGAAIARLAANAAAGAGQRRSSGASLWRGNPEPVNWEIYGQFL